MSGAEGIAAERLKSFISRIENLEAEKAEIANDIKEVMSEAKSAGFDVKTIRMILKLRKMDEAERQEQEMLLDTYLKALGMLADTPLGDAAVKRAAKKLVDGLPPGTSVSVTMDGKTTTARKVDAASPDNLPGKTADPPHDPETGEIHDDAPKVASSATSSIASIRAQMNAGTAPA